MSKRKAVDDAPAEDASAKKPAAGGVEDVQALLKKREEARKAKDWTTADALRTELRALGVQLFDQEGVWKGADGNMGMYTSGKLADGGIKLMLDAREAARKAKDFALADSIREDLRARGLQISDDEKKWTSTESGRSGYFGGKQPPVYAMLPQFGMPPGFGAAGMAPGGAPPPSSEADILYLVAQREIARMSNDWGTADRLRDTLRAAGINLSDNDHTWTAADGRSGTIDRDSAAATVASHGGAAAYCGQMQMGQMPGGPQQAMIPAQMAQMYGQPQLMPPSQMYGAPVEICTTVAAGDGLSAAGVQQIQAMVSQRESARRIKDYATGDQLSAAFAAEDSPIWMDTSTTKEHIYIYIYIDV